jgi:CRISPR system Cascade subunit CasA
MSNSANFNLVDEKWIRVIDNDGKLQKVSLLDAFTYAHKYKSLANELPTVDVAILRLLLAIMYGALFNEENEGKIYELIKENPDYTTTIALAYWNKLYTVNKFHEDIFKNYLEIHKDKFYLFGEDPFMQMREVRRKENNKTGTYYKSKKLISELSISNNKPRLFNSRIDNAAILHDEAARWLVHLNAFDDSGNKADPEDKVDENGEKKPSPGTGWLGKLGIVYVKGDNLFKTLMLNWVLLDSNNDFIPRGQLPWEKSPEKRKRKKINMPKSLAEIYTVRSRQVLLLQENENDSRVTGYNLISGVFWDLNNSFSEPMTMWERGKGKNANNFVPKKHDQAQQAWRDFSSVMPYGNSKNARTPGIVHWIDLLTPSNESAVGITQEEEYSFLLLDMKYDTAQKSKIENVFYGTFAINTALFGKLSGKLQQAVREALSKTTDVVNIVYNLGYNLAVANGVRSEDECMELANKEKARLYSKLNEPFKLWLVGLKGSSKDESDDGKGVRKIEEENLKIEEYVHDWHVQLKEIVTHFTNGMLSRVSDPAFVLREHQIKVKGSQKGTKHITMNVSLAENRFRKSLYSSLGNIKASASKLAKDERDDEPIENTGDIKTMQLLAHFTIKRINTFTMGERADLRNYFSKSAGTKSKTLKEACSAFRKIAPDLTDLQYEKSENAIVTALTIYAFHAQGGRTPHQRHRSLLKVAGKLRQHLDSTNNVLSGLSRTFALLYSAKTYSYIDYYAKRMVQFMREKDDGDEYISSFDYAEFAKDLYRMQSTDLKVKNAVLHKWGRDYFVEYPSKQEKQGKALSVGKFVLEKIKKLQDGDTGKTHAILAELRSCAGKSIEEAPKVLDFIYEDFGKSFPYAKQSSLKKIENTVFATLTLYALHAQGKKELRKNDARDALLYPYNEEQTFAQSARQLASSLEMSGKSGSIGLTRAFNSLVTAKRLTKINQYLKTIVVILRDRDDGIKYAFNYERLAEDINLLQSTNAINRNIVLRRWGTEYYREWQITAKDDAKKKSGGLDATQN